MKTKNYPQQVSDKETEILLELLRYTDKTPGDVVELGCYKGDTSVLLERVIEREFFPFDPQKHLWIYDSFAGLPEKSSYDSSVAGDGFQAGELLATKREVIGKFNRAGLKIPRIRKGFFDKLNPTNDLPRKISFAFLDGDLYNSIKTSLGLVWWKLSEGAIVVIHDYNNPSLPGVAKAVDEWREWHPTKMKQMGSLAVMFR